ncbi:hemolysin III [Galliscardovia ingluviei]|uniref:Hemolysin III n=1 Tax=Galliscardovia ingluviei TaxID=1769422 RepID=A0A8J3EY02_9BIFI|nr:hemolysin III family protein [Galliscardovia ingluviei]GGI13672.1 hemolysin III [Galliscardovia ingluviei]
MAQSHQDETTDQTNQRSTAEGASTLSEPSNSSTRSATASSTTSVPTDEQQAAFARTAQAVKEARIHDAHVRAQVVRTKGHAKAQRIESKAELKARKIENRALGIRKIRLDVHGRPKPAMRGMIHLIAAPLALAAGIVLICLAPSAPLRWACAVFMVSSLILFGNSALYHLGDWSPKVTDILRRIDHVNIFLLIAGTYTPVSFALEPFWRNLILATIWTCTVVALLIHVIWINTPRWLYAVVYILFGVSGVAYLRLFWLSPHAGPAVVCLIVAGGLCYIAGAIVYIFRKPDPWPKVFGFHEIFHCGTVLGFACHMVAIYFVIVSMW